MSFSFKKPSAAAVAQPPRFSGKLMVIIDELTKVFAEENMLLDQRDFSRQVDFSRRKDHLSTAYQAALKELHDHETLKASLSEEERIALRGAGAALDKMAEYNAQALRMAHKATERLLHVVMDEVRREVHRESGYSIRGHLAAAESARSRPVAFNQRV